MIRELRTSVLMLSVITILTGVVYPLLVTMTAQTVFPHQANGSLIVRSGRIIGSGLVGQSFSRPEYFQGRLSATVPYPYNAAASGGSNYGPLHPDLRSSAESRISGLTRSGVDRAAIPVDLVTASGSGLDPHLSPAAAAVQIPRVARARGLSEDTVRELVARHTAERQFGILGEPRVNVLLLNLALDELREE